MTDRNILINDLNSLFDQFWSDRDIDINNSKIPTNKYNACMIYLYDNYIYTLELYNPKGFKQYSYIDYINIVEWYITKSLEHDIISIYGLCLLLNRSLEFIRNIKYLDSSDVCNSFIIDIDNSIVNSSSIDNDNNVVLKTISSSNNNSINSLDCQPESLERVTILCKDITNKAFEYLQQSTVSKLNDTPLGIVTNANNNKDVGLLYAKERIQETAKARLIVALNDLPKLE